MLWQCRCCGFMTPDHLRISSHMKEMHNIKFTANPVTKMSDEELERKVEMAREIFENSFTSGSDMVKYSANTEEKGL